MLATISRNFQRPSALHKTPLGLTAPRPAVSLSTLKQRSTKQHSQPSAAATTLHITENDKSSSSSSSGDDSDSSQPSTTPYPSPDNKQQQQQQEATEQQPPSRSPSPGLFKTSGSNSSSSSKQNPASPEPPGGPPNSLPPQLQRLLLLLTEFGGIYGTAAVVIAWFTHVDPFGALHWDVNNVLFGLRIFLPILVLDAVLMLPDYSIRPEESQEVAGMFFGDPNALRNMSTGSLTVGPGTAVADDTSAGGTSGDSAPLAATDGTKSDTSATVSQQANPSSGNPVLRMRVALELLQQVYTKANPGIGLSPVAELVVVAVAVLADEMLYRAVGLTLLGLWVRDRLFEAGADETVSLDWLGHTLTLDTSEFAKYAAVGLIACLGIGGFAAGAFRERESLKRMTVLDQEGKTSEKTEELKAQLMSQISSQNVVMYGVEGFREVTASIMAGVSFVATGNLAAPMAGSLAAQTLFSLYQRYALSRTRTKRKELLDKMKQRSQKLQAAMAAALVAKQTAEPAAAAAAAAADDDDEQLLDGSSNVNAADEGKSSISEQSSSSSSSENVDFLTLVLQAAEEQERQQTQQRQQRASLQHNNSSSTTAAADTSSSTVANWEPSTTEASSSSSSDAAAGEAESAAAAKQQLSALLEDMLRSPEGFKVVQQWMGTQNPGGTSSSDHSSSSSGLSKDPREAVDQLLSDPETKAKLLQELQEQLCAISEAQMQQQKQQDSWRQ